MINAKTVRSAVRMELIEYIESDEKMMDRMLDATMESLTDEQTEKLSTAKWNQIYRLAEHEYHRILDGIA